MSSIIPDNKKYHVAIYNGSRVKVLKKQSQFLISGILLTSFQTITVQLTISIAKFVRCVQ